MKNLFLVIAGGIVLVIVWSTLHGPERTLPVNPTLEQFAVYTLGDNAKTVVVGTPGATKITFSLEPWALTKGTMASAFNSNVTKLVPAMFARFPNLDELEVHGTGSFTDIRGNQAVADIAWVDFKRGNVATIHWDKIDQSNVVKLADRAWVHPSMRELIGK